MAAGATIPQRRHLELGSSGPDYCREQVTTGETFTGRERATRLGNWIFEMSEEEEEIYMSALLAMPLRTELAHTAMIGKQIEKSENTTKKKTSQIN